MSVSNINNTGTPVYNPSTDSSSGTNGGVDPFAGSGSQAQLFQEIEQLLPEIMQVLSQLGSVGGTSGADQGSNGIDDGTDPGDGSTDPGDGSAYSGYGASDPGDGSTDPGDGSAYSGYGASDPGYGATDPTGGPSLDPSQSQQSDPALTNSYNNVMNLISANGTNPTDITNAINQFETQAGSQYPNIQNAMNNIKNSINDGTYSQQGSQGALQGAAQQDGLQGGNTPQIDGNAGMGNQNAGWYDSGSAGNTNTFKNSSVGANTSILANEISGGASSSQIKANALALAKEAQAAGMSNVANAAQNIANSVDDGSYDGPASGQALASATNTDNLQSGATPVSWKSN